MIEKESKIKMKTLNSPSPSEVIEASKNEMIFSFKDVNQTVLSEYISISEKILEIYDEKEALCRALAIINGNEKGFKQKSLITNQDNFITYQVIGDIDTSVTNLFPFFNVLTILICKVLAVPL